MILAKGRNGRIGRQVMKQGMGAEIVQPSQAGFQRNLYLSEGQIAADHNYFTRLDQEKKAREAYEAKKQIERAAMARLVKAKNLAGVEPYQRLAKVDPMMGKLREHFAKQNRMPQHERTARSMMGSVESSGATSGGGPNYPKPRPPADFSSTGANMHLVADPQPQDSVVWAADFRRGMIKGNPLTRDGKFGPAVTDFDRFVQGTDVNDRGIGRLPAHRFPIAGNTMVGRYEGKGKKGNGMGFDWSWEGISDAFSNIADQTSDNLVDSLPDQLAKEVQDAITGGGHATTNPATGQVTIVRPGTTTQANTVMGVPKWALYTGIGMLGLGVLFLGVKVARK